MDEEDDKNREKEERIGIWDTLKSYFILLKNYKLVIFVILFLVFFLEARHIIESYLFKILVDKGTLFAGGALVLEEFTRILMILLGVFGIIVATGFIGRWFQQHLVNDLVTKVMVDLKAKYFNHLIGLDHNFHSNHKTGSLISRISRASAAVERISEVLTYNIISVIFSFAIVFASLLYFDIVSALVILVVAAVFISYSYVMQNISQRANMISNNAEDRENAAVSDIFGNIESVRYFGKENFVKKKFADIITLTRMALMKHWGYYRWIDSVHSITIGIGTILLLYFPLVKFLNGEITLGTIVFIYSVYGNMVEPLYGFVYGLRTVYGSIADFQSLFKYEKIEKEIQDKPNAKKFSVRSGEIEFKNVSFNYGRRKIFENLNVVFPKNKKVALVGSSGSGKTTLVRLLYRFYDISSGQILIDEEDIRDFKQESLRGEMSIVPQECILFDDTLYNNIAFSNPSASKEKVMDAIKFAHLDKMIENLPDKEQTIVGERGVKLSGGEKQRVSIARAILADKQILVLDEATSALDSETEYEIQKDLTRLMQGRTSIIIAHRLSTIMNADKIIVFKGGKVIQEGRHFELVDSSGEYRKLWKLQKEGILE
ncbi:MAG: ABC transporter ATP-binding protein [Nanoarchaeota archaeon]